MFCDGREFASKNVRESHVVGMVPESARCVKDLLCSSVGVVLLDIRNSGEYPNKH
jgi:hypothetical protein